MRQIHIRGALERSKKRRRIPNAPRGISTTHARLTRKTALVKQSMAIFFGHRTALAFWRLGKLPENFPLSRALPSQNAAGKQQIREAWQRAVEACSTAAAYDPAKQNPLDMESELARPLDIIVADASLRRNSQSVTCRLWKDPAPGRSFVKVAEGCYVSTPEACFLQLSHLLDYESMLLVGMELCGSYLLAPGTVEGFRQRGWGQSLTIHRKLLRYLKRASENTRTGKARNAALPLANGAASPAESQAFLLLCLPRKKGGYALDKPALNQRLLVSRHSVSAIPESLEVPFRKTRRPDFFWPASKLALEYESSAHHSSHPDISRDSMRRIELERAGVHVMTLTNRQLYDRDLFDRVARTIAKKTGKRLHDPPAQWFKKQLALRNKILHAHGRLPKEPPPS